MIYTLTLNPSIDYIINVEKFAVGSINLTKSEYKLPGGKGINVSQVLTNLQTPNTSYIASAPKGKLVNSVGAGDSLVAGFTCGIYKGLNIVEAFKLGIACGSASAFSENLCTQIEVDQLLKEVKVEQII